MKRTVYAVVALVMASVLASCSSSSTRANGALAFGQPSYTVTSGSTASLLLSLSNNTTTSGVTVTIASTNSGVAVPVYTPCVLSDEPGSTSSCEIQVKGLGSGSATVTATAPGVKSASATVAVSTAPQTGSLGFTPTAEPVTVGSFQHVTVKLSTSSGVAGQSVTIASSDTTIATVTPSVVVLSTDAPAQTIKVNGVKAGNATVTATATGYTSATNAVTVGATPVPGKLAFAGNVNLAVGESKGGTLSLQGSSNVSPFTATLTPDNADVTVVPATCPLSTTTRTCPFTIKGNLAGNDKITATAVPYTPATMIASVSQGPVPGNFYFSAAQETVVIGTPGSVTLTYSGGSGVVNLPVTLSTNNGNATISPLSCPMSNTSGSSTWNITITGVTASPTPTIITAAATGYTSAQNTVNVQAAGPVYGNLSFSSANVPVPLGGNVQLTLTLNQSSDVASLPVTLAA